MGVGTQRPSLPTTNLPPGALLNWSLNEVISHLTEQPVEVLLELELLGLTPMHNDRGPDSKSTGVTMSLSIDFNELWIRAKGQGGYRGCNKVMTHGSATQRLDFSFLALVT
ncbi:G2 and S phase-expressed protein 1 [Platysternon megacephalum]|uniref:G2 and S phase-expressed protein 1 n=1 Tax=Platysternon megacephalum TaxID=55544 RepID=A0A4D9E642_9SAUR|nr:G2 and S phase-expressed protein 1 [Platysternon megacephalum]